jgi:hypothetical protein
MAVPAGAYPRPMTSTPVHHDSSPSASGVTEKPLPEDTSMFINVVVGVDGRNGGRDAILLAHQLADGSARVTRRDRDGTRRVLHDRPSVVADQHPADGRTMTTADDDPIGRPILGDIVEAMTHARRHAARGASGLTRATASRPPASPSTPTTTFSYIAFSFATSVREARYELATTRHEQPPPTRCGKPRTAWRAAPRKMDSLPPVGEPCLRRENYP